MGWTAGRGGPAWFGGGYAGCCRHIAILYIAVLGSTPRSKVGTCPATGWWAAKRIVVSSGRCSRLDVCCPDHFRPFDDVIPNLLPENQRRIADGLRSFERELRENFGQSEYFRRLAVKP